MKRQKLSAWLLILCILSGFGISTAKPQQNEAAYWFERAVSENNQEKKVEYYLKAIEKKPNFIEAYFNLALTYLTLKKYDQAEDAFKKAMYANPAALSTSLKSNILSRLGTMYRRAGRYQEAEESFQAALNIATDKKFRALTYYELGQNKLAQGQYEEAIKIFRQGIAISPTDRASFETGIQLAESQRKIQTMSQQASQLAQNGKAAEAAEIYNRILEIDPNHQEAKAQLKKLNLLVEQKQSNDIERVQRLYDEAQAHLNNGEWSEAIALLEKVNQLQPNFKEANKLILQAQEKQYQQLIVQQLYDKGQDNFDKGNYVIALVNFERVAEIDANFKNISERIATTRKKIEQTNQRTDNLLAQNDSRQSRSDEASRSDIISNESATARENQVMGQIQGKSDAPDGSLDVQLIQNYYQEALDLMQKQDWLKAGIVLEKIKLIHPNYKNTEFLLAQARQNLERSNYSPAENTAAAGDKSGNPAVLLLAFLAGIVVLPVGLFFLSPVTRARYYILQKRYDKAREIYERLLSKKPNDIKLYITLANIYINERRIDEVSIRVFERAIQYNDNLKIQLEPIVHRYYLEKGKTDDSPLHLLNDSLKEKLRKMGE
ncbi:MAG: tetratricopeptide repeat protein [candidate division KSB1 bacterium]|nr:tetratricopeptide repeat protein [candidate division KSB1 bacterium]MDZ7319124.1 tetratricopeptide repeat protein [candidate division KSB1 bacterium]MDZ7341265.1 tetratricopeptide repeat protein [candidate division KSB1 bacterium]